MKPVLLGQYQVTGTLNNVLESIKMELTDNGYITSGGSEIPLLNSTQKLLSILRVKQQDPEKENAMDVSEIDETEGGTPTKAPKEEAHEVRPEDEPFQTLVLEHELAGAMEAALHDIRRLRQRNYNAIKQEQRQSYNQRRHKALEKQREKLQKHLSGESIEETQQQQEDPWILLARVHNSIQTLTPILIKILLHERRKDHELKINGHALKKDKRKGQCWLLGEKVHAVTSVNLAKRLYKDLQAIWLFLGVSAESVVVDSAPCKEAMEKAMQSLVKQQKFRIKHPFESLAPDDQAKLNTLTPKLDQQCGLLEEKNKEDEEKYLKAVEKLQQRVSSLVHDKYPDARLTVYGSSLSGLSLNSSDVDLSLYVKQLVDLKNDFEDGSKSVKKYEKEMTNTVFTLSRRLGGLKKEFRELNPVARARVPVVNGTYIPAENPYSEDGSLHFDICFLNDIAVANSNLLKEYTHVDPRVRQLMVTVKRWAKSESISSSKDNALSSYAWMVLTIFYLQNIGFVPNLQSKELLDKVERKGDEYWDSVNNLNTVFVSWEQASKIWSMPKEVKDLSVSSLLYGFYSFYANDFPWSVYMVSLARDTWVPKSNFRRSTAFLCIEDPFELYDSHIPHDLSMPVSEPNQVKIVEKFQSQEKELRKMLLGLLDDPNSLNSRTQLWSAMEETKNADVDTAKSGKEKRNRRKPKKDKAAVEEAKKETSIDEITSGVDKLQVDGEGKVDSPSKSKKKRGPRNKKGKKEEATSEGQAEESPKAESPDSAVVAGSASADGESNNKKKGKNKLKKNDQQKDAEVGNEAEAKTETAEESKDSNAGPGQQKGKKNRRNKNKKGKATEETRKPEVDDKEKPKEPESAPGGQSEQTPSKKKNNRARNRSPKKDGAEKPKGESQADKAGEDTTGKDSPPASPEKSEAAQKKGKNAGKGGRGGGRGRGRGRGVGVDEVSKEAASSEKAYTNAEKAPADGAAPSPKKEGRGGRGRGRGGGRGGRGRGGRGRGGGRGEAPKQADAPVSSAKE